MKKVVKKIIELGVKYVVIKGGKVLESDKVIDLLYDGKEFIIYEVEKIFLSYNYGVGCIFVVVIIVGFVKGLMVEEVVVKVKDFVIVVIKGGFVLNEFIGFVWYGVYNKVENR